MSTVLSDTDRIVLERIQSNFPVHPHPYRVLADELGFDEKKLFNHVRELTGAGYIRRFGPSLNLERLGLFSTLAATKVPEDKIDLVTSVVNSHEGVTHNYLRSHQLNMWFTLIARSRKEIADTLKEIKESTELKCLLEMPSRQLFKIDVRFKLNANLDNYQAIPEWKYSNNILSSSTIAEDKLKKRKQPVSAEDWRILTSLLQGIPLSLTPFQEIADSLSLTEKKLMVKTESYCSNGIIRRFGVTLNHNRIGFTANVMSVWQVSEENVLRTGNYLASLPQISHCYERVTHPDWHYNLYAMIHAHSNSEYQQLAEMIAEEIKSTDFLLLRTLKELKKSTLEAFLKKFQKFA